VDVVNHFEFPDGQAILKNALQIAPRLARLKKRARDSNISVVYVNDNFGQWRSDAGKLLAHCLRTDCAGKPFVEAVHLDEQAYCVLKPMLSAFFQTPFDLLLRHLGARSFILVGIAILCTAHDANMRASDCCAARSAREHNEAIGNIREMASARVITLSLLRLRTNKGGYGRAR
jgi:nicotinamidase-related amidase